jgi:hypothetical protein
MEYKPYLGALEFYLEYGDFDEYYRTSKSYCGLSRELVNPTAVYSAAEQTRLAQAKLSDKTVLILYQEEVKAMANRSSTATKLGIINLKC